MCGRTGLSLNKYEVQCACSYKNKRNNKYIKPDWLHEHNDGKDYVASYNIAPTDVTPVLVSASKFKNSAHTDRILKPMMWGIIPPWHKGNYRSHNLSTNNCRLENIKSSKLYSPILNSGGRCIIVAEGFYEWQTTNNFSKVKQPYYIYAPQDENVQIDEPQTFNNTFSEEEGWQGVRLLHMAGLYYVWQQNNNIIYSYSVITMNSNSTLSWLHHRMPAILDTEDQIEAWLNIDEVNPDMALAYLTPINILLWHQVSAKVNNSRYKSDDCNKKLPAKKSKSSQKTLSAWLTKSVKRRSTEDNSNELKKLKN